MTKAKSEEDRKAAEDVSIQVPKGIMKSKQQFDCSYDMHVEFLCPPVAPERSRDHGNPVRYRHIRVLPVGDK